MKILASIPMVAILAAAPAGLAGAAAAQDMAQPAPTSQSQTTAAADMPPAVAPAAVDATGNVPAIPDQIGAPASGATAVAATITNGPVPDTPANRAKYGGPMSHAGKKTAPAGN